MFTENNNMPIIPNLPTIQKPTKTADEEREERRYEAVKFPARTKLSRLLAQAAKATSAALKETLAEPGFNDRVRERVAKITAL